MVPEGVRITLAELLRAANHDEWWNDDKQVYCEVDGDLYPLTGICGGRPEKKGQGKDIVVLLTEERNRGPECTRV